MGRFSQFHVLTSYPAANLNRDDTGRPKTVTMGGVLRLRISSQSLKRSWRTSDLFKQMLDGHLGERTQRLGDELFKYLISKSMKEDKAKENARKIAEVFGKLKDKKDPHPTRIEQLAFIGPAERKAAFELADEALNGKKIEPKADEVLLPVDKVADIAMFGRMLADNPKYNREAAVQVSHAFTTHRVIVEDDYYTAVDDLKDAADAEDAGAGFIGVQEFGSGVFYIYICIDCGLLLKNLGGNENKKVAGDAIKALLEASATVSPKGKQASFASRSRASYILVEKGNQQPRSLAAAFLNPVGGKRKSTGESNRKKKGSDDYMELSIDALEDFRKQLEHSYGPCAEEHRVMNVPEKKGKMADLLELVSDLSDIPESP